MDGFDTTTHSLALDALARPTRFDLGALVFTR
jgi:hypothetical protein